MDRKMFLNMLLGMAKYEDYKRIIETDDEIGRPSSAVAHLVLAPQEIVDFFDIHYFGNGHRARWILKAALMLRSRDWEKYKDDDNEEIRAVARKMLGAE